VYFIPMTASIDIAIQLWEREVVGATALTLVLAVHTFALVVLLVCAIQSKYGPKDPPNP
jgi:hypothetical protein